VTGVTRGNNILLISVRQVLIVVFRRGVAGELQELDANESAVCEKIYDLPNVGGCQSDDTRVTAKLQNRPIFRSPSRAENMRVRHAGNHVNNIAVPRQNARHRLDYVFDALVWREQAEREQHIFSFSSKAILEETGIGKRQIGDPVGDEIDFVRRDVKHFSQNIGGLLAHDNESIRQSRNFRHQPCVDRCLGSRRTVCNVVTTGI